MIVWNKHEVRLDIDEQLRRFGAEERIIEQDQKNAGPENGITGAK